MDNRRFTPYGRYSPRSRNTQAGPSTQVPPPTPYDAASTAQPTGGHSETSADAEQNNQGTEEDETPVSDFYCSLIPHVTDFLLDLRRLEPGAPVARVHHAPTANAPRGPHIGCESG